MVQPPPLKPTPEVKALLDQAQRAVQSRNAPRAAVLYDEALSKARELKDPTGEATTLQGIGIVYRNTGKPQKALELINQALAIFQVTGNKSGEAGALQSIGILYSVLGQPQKALEVYNQALLICQASGDKRREANVLNGIGVVYFSTGQPQKALELFTQSLPIFQAIGDKGSELGALQNIGNYYTATRQSEKALEFYNQALPLTRALGDTLNEASMLTNIGGLYASIGQPQKALDFYNQALPIRRAIGDKSGEAATLQNIGTLYASLGQPQKALEFYDQSLPIRRALGDTSNEAATHKRMAETETLLKHPAQAEEHYGQAIALYETIRDNMGGLSEAKTSFLRSTISTYYGYLTLLLERGNSVNAFEIAQKTKARSLLDLMASGRVNLDSELTAEEQAQDKALSQKASVLNQQMVKEGVENEVGAKKRFAALKEELKATESQLQTFTDTLYARHPKLAQKRVAKTATVTDITRLLPADTALLDYIVLSQDKLALFVVTRHGVKVLTLPLHYASLVTKAADFRTTCADPRKDYKKSARDLYVLLLAPATKHLAGIKRLVICPDGALWDVPFQALVSEGKFLAQRYELSYAYSATGAQAALTVKAGRKKPTQTVLAIANPDFGSSKRFGDLDNLPGQRPLTAPNRPLTAPNRPIDNPSRLLDAPSSDSETILRGNVMIALPGTQREANALKRLFPSATLMTGKAAQEDKAKSEASQYKYLHFATHGFFNNASPMLSSLVLAQPSSGSKDDGFLTAREIFELDLLAEMVVLSACNTARGVQRTGDGVIGLTWALFVAGCPTQVVSQWAVDDASTATLMTSFYGNLAKGKMGKGAALRQASLSLMSSPKHAHPYYWAPFILMGDWR